MYWHSIEWPTNSLFFPRYQCPWGHERWYACWHFTGPGIWYSWIVCHWNQHSYTLLRQENQPLNDLSLLVHRWSPACFVKGYWRNQHRGMADVFLLHKLSNNCQGTKKDPLNIPLHWQENQPRRHFSYDDWHFGAAFRITAGRNWIWHRGRWEPVV